MMKCKQEVYLEGEIKHSTSNGTQIGERATFKRDRKLRTLISCHFVKGSLYNVHIPPISALNHYIGGCTSDPCINSVHLIRNFHGHD